MKLEILEELKEKEMLTLNEQNLIADALVNGSEEDICAILCTVAERLSNGS